jgi:hypothetical protein
MYKVRIEKVYEVATFTFENRGDAFEFIRLAMSAENGGEYRYTIEKAGEYNERSI